MLGLIFLRVSRFVRVSREHRRGDPAAHPLWAAHRELHPGDPVRVLLPALKTERRGRRVSEEWASRRSQPRGGEVRRRSKRSALYAL